MRQLSGAMFLTLALFLTSIGVAAMYQRIVAPDRITLDRAEWRCTLWRQVEGLEARRCVTYRRIEAEPAKGTGA